MSRPNIVYLVCHDLGRHLGCYGVPVPSPAIDRFADESVVFTNAFCNAPACSPSRGCAMTGRYSHSNGLMGLVNIGWSLPESERTIVDELRDAGYQTAHFGFQHERATAAANRYEIEGNGYTPDDWVDRPDEWAENVIDRAKTFLDSRDQSRPFYLNLGTVDVHASRWAGGLPEATGQNRAAFYGVDPPEESFVPIFTPDTEGTREMFGRFQGSIRHLDRQFARLLDALDSRDLRDNTIVVFTTDHGILTERSKMWLYDKGCEIALIMQVPGAAPGRFDGLLGNIDVAPTLLDLCGVEVSEAMQGVSLSTVFSGGDRREPIAATAPRPAVRIGRREEVFTERNYHGNYDPMRAVRTRQFHYIRNFAVDTGDSVARAWQYTDPVTLAPWRDGEPLDMWPERTQPRAPEELYDVTRDPGELVNLAYRPEYGAIKQDLSGRLDRWMRETGDPLLEGPIPDMANTWPGYDREVVRTLIGRD